MEQEINTRSISPAELRALLIAEVASILELEQPEIDPARAFDEYGVDSVGAVVLLNAVEEHLGMELDPEIVMRQRSINEIVDKLADMAVVCSSRA